MGRVRIAPAGAGAVSVELADGSDRQCCRCGVLMWPVSVEQLTAAAVPAAGLFEVDWSLRSRWTAAAVVQTHAVGAGHSWWRHGELGACGHH